MSIGSMNEDGPLVGYKYMSICRTCEHNPLDINLCPSAGLMKMTD